MVREVSPISRGPATAKKAPSGSANMSALTPPAGAGASPSTSATKRAISGRRSVALPANTSPRISTG